MKLSIYGYGFPVLRQVCEEIGPDYPRLKSLLKNMFETMYAATGVGLAAPQIGLPIRIFIVDTEQTMEGEEVGKGIKKVFINAKKVLEGGNEWDYEEGCLSIPEIRGDVNRPSQIRLKWVDENFQEHEDVFTGINARVIQHEYDHIEGVLFTDLLKPLKKRLVKKKLEKIQTGKIDVEYKMKFYGKK